MQALAKASELERRKEGLLGRRARLKQLLEREEEEYQRELKQLPRSELEVTDLREIRQQFRLVFCPYIGDC